MAKSHDDVKFPRLKDDTVKFLHFREIDERGNVNPRGGVTIAYRSGSTNAVYYGVARCSEADNFEKVQGRSLSHTRLAMMRYPETGVIMGVDNDKDFAHYMSEFIRDKFGYVRKFSRKNRKHG